MPKGRFRFLYKRRKRGAALAAAMLLCVGGAGCARQSTAEDTAALRVVTSFYPVYLLAQAVIEGADGVQLENMAQPQTGCLHDYELTIDDMKLLEGADVLLINGGGMESFLDRARAQYPDLQVVDTSAGIDLLPEEIGHDHAGETAEEHAAHAHEGNPHIWLSPLRAAEQAEAIAAALSERDTADAAVFAENAAAFRAAAEALQAEVEPLPEGTGAAVFHEGFAYLTELCGAEAEIGIFADEYELPSAKELAEAAEEAKEHDVRLYLAAADSGETYANVLAAEAGAAVLLLDPLTTADGMEGRSYIERMRANIEAMAAYGKEALQ